ncbi:MAG: exonuclease SbcCD subunit D [Clostridium sp.]|uniref:exonuclease SbcCD subunit D n=1 Tax=Clostridium sp. DSM 8431 TaxID=1761781 RepID=UPI0008F072BD|nr:exonuclease SbcCD subunit D [Clostridium sp. DSM 8431]MCR4944821.1 exonuclease SbcCD subunit D [Clostridium sp.]SFU38873.1 Exodeoxyribonuclease I subunit D [Clostridium sp. DSM 8431]
MKIVHTGDWHIGKIVNEFSMIEDQKYVLNDLIKLIKKEEPDVLIIAGDIYDRSIPPVEAVELLNNVFEKILNESNTKILAIAGNHDSAERLSFASNMLEKSGLYIVGNIKEDFKKITINKDNINYNFYLIPYTEPAVLRKKYENKSIKDHNDAMKFLIDKIKEDFDESAVNIAVAHGYVTLNREKALDSDDKDKYEVAEIEVSDSERPLSIGGTDLIDGKVFENFDYVALGHLHGRQRVGRDNIRYSGSLLKYSFSEVNHKNGVTILEFDENKELTVRQEELKTLRNMRTIKGPIDELIKVSYECKEENGDYIQAILTDEGELIDPIGKLRAVYPNIMLLRKEERNSSIDSNTAASQGYKSKSELELFKEYYERLGDGEFSKEKEEVLSKVIKEVLSGGEE